MEKNKPTLEEIEKCFFLGRVYVNTVLIKNNRSNKSSWTYSDWEKKDAEGLTNMYKNNRSQYDSLLNKWLQTKI